MRAVGIPVSDLPGTVFAAQRACRLCSIIDPAGEAGRAERMAELMARAAKKSVSSRPVTRQRGKSRTPKLTAEKERRGHDTAFFSFFPALMGPLIR